MLRITARPSRLSVLVPLASLLLSLVPAIRTVAAPIQNDTARIWTDTFTDDTGVTLAGNASFDAAGQRIVLSRQAPALAAVTSSIPVTGQALSVTVNGNRLYVATGTGGLAIYDVTTPGTPTLVGSLVTNSAQEIAVSGNVAYVADGTSGVQVVDVTSANAPVLATTLATTGDDTGVAISGSVLYVAQGDGGVRSYDVSVPLVPTPLGSVETGPGAVRDVAAAGTNVFTAETKVGGFGAGLVAVDASVPATPVVVGTLVTPQDALEVALLGTTAFLANTNAGLGVVDISNPASPTSSAVVPTVASAEGIAVTGSTAIVAVGTAGVEFFDVATPANPLPQSVVDTPGTAHAVATLGSVVYVADDGFITIINAPTPASSSLQIIPSVGGGTVSDLAFVGSRLYASEEGSGIVVYGIAGDGTLTQLGTYVTAGPAHAVAVSGNTAFVAIGSAGLVALDVTNPAAIAPLGTINLSDAQDVVLVGNRALVANGSGGVTVVNVSNPAGMSTVTTLGTGGTAVSILAPGGNAAYVGTQAGTVAVLNITTIDSPSLATTLTTTGAAVNLSAGGGLLAVAATDRAQLYSMSSPLAPTLLSTVTPAGTVNGVSLSGTTLAVATAAPNQVVYYDVTNPSSPSLLGSYGLVGPALDVTLAGGTLYAAASTAIQIAGGVYQSPGTATSVVIAPAAVTRWNELVVGETLASGTTITYDILTSGGATIAGYTGLVPAGGRIDLTGLTGVAYPSIRVRANLATTDVAVTPALNDWTVTWDSACLLSTSPVNGATVVQRNSAVILTFSEAVNLATLTYTSDFAGTFTSSINAAGTVVTLTPTTPFPASTTITVNVTFVETTAGNHVTCFNVPNPFSFTTGLYLGPVIVSTVPADAAINVDRLAPLVVTFSDPMNTGTVALTCSSGGPFTVVWSAGDTVATFSHTTLFAPMTGVTCQVTAGDDVNGRPLQPGPVPNPWTFNTLAYANPYITTTSPADTATNVDRLAPVVVTFTDPMNTGTVVFSCTGGVPFTVAWSAGDTVATYSHGALWPANAAITCQVTAGQDATGRALNPGPVPNPWTFTTGAVARPYIVSTTPVNGATDVDRLAPVTVTFSDPMNLATLALTCSSGGPFVATLDATGTLATFTHAALWPANTVVTCTAAGQDTTGRTVQSGLVPNPFSFTTGSVARPYIVSTTPVNGATDVDRLALVTVTFSDPMNLATLALTCSSGGPFVATLDATGTIATFTHMTLWPANVAVTCTASGSDTTGRAVQTSLVPNPWTFTTGAVARPYIVSTVPANAATGVALGACVVVTFSDPMNTGSLVFSSSFAGPYVVTWSAGSTVATFCHANPFLSNTLVTFSIDSIADATGRPVLTSLVPNPFSFTTVAGPIGFGTEFTITAFIGGSIGSNHPGGVGSSTDVGGPNNNGGTDDDDDDDDDDDNDDGKPPYDCRFSDVPNGHWAYPFVREICLRSISSGYPNGTFGPDLNVSRAEFLKFVLRMNNLALDSTASQAFPDVNSSHSLYAYIQTGRRLGIVTGYHDGTFRPNAPVTRAEAIKILFNGAGIQVGTETTTSFSDVRASDWFATFVSFAERNQIVDGGNDRIFAPYANLTRAEAAKIITKALKLAV